METKTKNELIIEGSALLAEFIGWHKQSGTTYMVPNNYPFDYPSGETEFSPDSFEFHKRWDWIMPVVETISNFVYEVEEVNDGLSTRIETHRAYPRTFGMQTDDGRWMVRFNRNQLHVGESFIETVFFACVDFVTNLKSRGGGN